MFSIWRNLSAGTAVAVLMVGGVGWWATTTEISGAVIGHGSLVVNSNLRKVQHPTGGVVGEILVKDGDKVKAGDVLLRLDPTVTKANLGVVESGLNEAYGRKARLEAERDSKNKIVFPKGVSEEVRNAEQKLFDLRRHSRAGEKEQLTEQLGQLRKLIAGIESQTKAKENELTLISRELEGIRDLWAKRLTTMNRLTQLEREQTRIAGEKAALEAQNAQTRGKISETEIKIAQIDKDLSSEVAKELRETDAKIGELKERRVAAADTMMRVDILAPINGTIHQSTVHTVGGVIPANAEPVMMIVPENDTLTVEVKVSPAEIDQIHVGQDARVRFLAFNQRTTPEINGKVQRIGADAEVDKRTGEPFYTVRVVLESPEIKRLGDVKLIPGLPVESFINTGDRLVITYLMKPLMEQMNRALRER